MSGTYHNTLDEQTLILKDCGENPTTCADLIEGIRNKGKVYDAKCKRLPAEGDEVNTNGIGIIAKNVRQVYCGMCGLCGIERD